MPVVPNPGIRIDGKLNNPKAATRKNLSTDMKVGRQNVFDYTDSAVSDGSTDARAAILAADTVGPVILPPGTYAIASNMTLSNKITFDPGAKLKPASGIVITLNGGYIAEDTQHVFDISAGGTFQIDKQRLITSRHFGALGNGVNTEDDSAAIQAALTEAVRSNATLDLTAGDFYIGSPLSIDCSGGTETVEIRGAGIERTIIRAMNSFSGSVLQLTNTNTGSAQYLHRSKLSDFMLSGMKPDGSRVDVVLDLPAFLHTTFSRVRVVGANRIAVKLGYNHSNRWVDCLIQPVAYANESHYVYGFVCTSEINYANEYSGLTLLDGDVGYLATSGGQGNTFTNCRPEALRVFGMYWNGGNAWSFNGYLESAGFTTVPHKFVTINNDNASSMPGGSWETQGGFCFNGTARAFATDISTTASGTGGTDTVTVASATGLYRGAKVEITGAGTSGGVLYTRIDSISGTTITLEDNLVGSVSSQAFLQPIQCSCDVSSAYPPTNISISTVGWSTDDTSSLYVVASAFGAKLAYPGLSGSHLTNVNAGTNPIIEFSGVRDFAADIEILGGNPSDTNLPTKYVRTHLTAESERPGCPELAKLSRWPWATKTVAHLPLHNFTLTSGVSWSQSSLSHQGVPLWDLTVDASGYVTGTNVLSFQQYPEFQGRWVAVDVDFICASTPWSGNSAFYAASLWIYAQTADVGLIADSSGVKSRPTALPEILVTGSVSSASTTLTVSSGTGFKVGDIVTVDGAGAAGALLVATLTAVSGATLTLDTAAGTTVSSVNVLRCAMQTRAVTFKTNATSEAMTMWLYGYVNEGTGHKLLIKDVRVREVGNPDYDVPKTGNKIGSNGSLGSGTQVFNFDSSKGHFQSVTATGAIALQFIASVPGYYTAVVAMDGTGGHTITYATTVKGTAPTINTTASEKTIIPLFYDGATWFHV